MFETQEKSTGTQYTLTAALLLLALVFTPAFVMLSRPVGYLTITLAIACSAVFLASSRLSWTRYSQLTIPSIAAPQGRSK
jgi:hypothetical protein